MEAAPFSPVTVSSSQEEAVPLDALTQSQYGTARFHPDLVSQRMALYDCYSRNNGNTLLVLYPLHDTFCSGHSNFRRKLRSLKDGVNQIQNHICAKDHLNRMRPNPNPNSPHQVVDNLTIISYCEYCEEEIDDVKAHFQGVHNVPYTRSSGATDLNKVARKAIVRVFKRVLSQPDDVNHPADMHKWVVDSEEEFKALLKNLQTQKKELKAGHEARSEPVCESDLKAFKKVMAQKAKVIREVKGVQNELKELKTQYEPYEP